MGTGAKFGAEAVTRRVPRGVAGIAGIASATTAATAAPLAEMFEPFLLLLEAVAAERVLVGGATWRLQGEPGWSWTPPVAAAAPFVSKASLPFSWSFFRIFQLIFKDCKLEFSGIIEGSLRIFWDSEIFERDFWSILMGLFLLRDF